MEYIRSASQKAVDLIKRKEQQLIDKVEEVTEREMKELQADVKMGNIQIQTCRQQSEYIKQAVNSDSEMDVCDVYQRWKSGQLDIGQKGEKEKEERRIRPVRFCEKKQNITDVLGNLCLGEVVTTYPVCDPMSTPALYNSVDVRVQHDQKDPCLWDVTVLVVDGIHTTVVTDWNNNCVKSFYTSNNETCHSRLPLDSSPWGIAQITDNQVMVTSLYSSKILIVAVTPDLVLLNTINTSKTYRSLTVVAPASLAAIDFGHVDILNLDGQVMKSVTVHNYKKLFLSPYYMCVSNTGHILVSDCKKNTITCLTSEGCVVWIYSGTEEGKLRYPSGITTTSTGDVLVVDTGLKKVIQLSESGQYVRDVLTSQDGLDCVTGICVDKQDSVYLCGSGEIKEFIFTTK